MRTETASHFQTPVGLLRGAVGFGAGAGVLIGGGAETVTWPIVGTFFGALAGVVLGAAIGLLDGLALLAVTRRTRSAWLVRVCSAAVAVVGVLIASLATGQFGSGFGRDGVGVVVAAGLFAGVLGPLVAFGVEPVALGPRAAPRPLPEVAAMVLLRAGLAGAVVGAVVGFIVGTRVYLPTAPVAAIEGAVLGVVSAVVVALLLGAVVVLPRLRVRR